MSMQVLLIIMVCVVAVAVTALVAIFGVQHHLDDRANQMSGGDELDRQNAEELREISRKMDHAKYWPLP
ncbi:hypothetical protein D2E25_1293 [Bifidobacterium goeldii]|uniref:Uncharacterized protein n=1 Tax=Bifidobacterium goeldii TaxID=2306975 RepID=A0A430FKL1_9BIFI|nr:hypothetical protein [Bifidobacterium goeldii]RSX53320.1 hypothetical protein D2E25_1293 [Bifidobacterium goeldii]